MDHSDNAYTKKIDRLCGAMVNVMEVIEKFQRLVYPPIIEELQQGLSSMLATFSHAARDFLSVPAPEDMKTAQEITARASDQLIEALKLISEADISAMQNLIVGIMKGLRKFCWAQETLFTARHRLPRINDFFLETALQGMPREPDPLLPLPITGLHHTDPDDDPYARRAFSYYVPESYDGSRPLPAITALHGGYGHGRDFIWTWLREARSRGCILLAPTSTGTTWSIGDTETDAAMISERIEEMTARLTIDRDRMLVTGVSDGGTFALSLCQRKESHFTAFAPVSCSLLPENIPMAKGRRIYRIHGLLDWMFPMDRAEKESSLLKSAGADIEFHRLSDLSHAYPREMNGQILEWFDTDLAL